MNRPIRILLVSPYSDKTVGGIGTWSKIVLDYSKGVDDCDVRFLNTVQGLPKRWSMNYRIAHLIVGIIDSLFIIVRLFFNMIILHPDVVHYTSSAGSALNKDIVAIWIVKNIFHKKFVIHWHFGRVPEIFGNKNKEYALFLKVSKRSDVSIAIDDRSYKVLHNNNIESVYIPNPIPITLQQEVESLDVKTLSSYRNSGEVLFVGHVVITKGIVELVRACTDCVLVKRLKIVGPFFDEQLKNRLQLLAKKRDNGNWLELLGEKSREDVWEYYKSCSVFCLPSYSEGFPYVILEAMSFGCPVVATKVGAIPEMLSDGCGELIEPKEVEKLKDSITNIMKNTSKAEKMGELAHNKVLDNYTIEHVFGKYVSVWK